MNTGARFDVEACSNKPVDRQRDKVNGQTEEVRIWKNTTYKQQQLNWCVAGISLNFKTVPYEEFKKNIRCICSNRFIVDLFLLNYLYNCIASFVLCCIFNATNPPQEKKAKG